MTQKNNQQLKEYATKLMLSAYQEDDQDRAYQYLCEKADFFSEIDESTFSLNYLAAKLAFSSEIWRRACEENGYRNEEMQKIFLKVIMASFQSEKYKELATAYGDYLYSPSVEKNPALAMTQRMFHRLKISADPASGKDEKSIVSVYTALVELLESYRMEFENAFFEFIHS